MIMDKSQLIDLQHLSLPYKVMIAKTRIREWYEHFEGRIYISFSGGKDSTVLKHIAEQELGLNTVPIVFCDTGLEYPELREFAINGATVVLKPNMTFKEVIEIYGYPIGSKTQARCVRDLQNESPKNKKVCDLHRTGITSEGRKCNTYKIAEKWKPLVDSEFKISEQCCDIMKKKPFKDYEKETRRFPVTGVMACESSLRTKNYLKNGGCNAFEAKRKCSTPLGIWTTQDVLQYIYENELEIAKPYGDVIKLENGTFETTGCNRTGCMFCMFGVQFEKEPNRFQRMKITHPKQYDYCINNLGLGKLLDFCEIPYR